jgi:hypothetical protein
MNTQELVQRTYEHLGIGQAVFWPESEVVTNGLNPAQRLLCLLKPDLYTLRTLIQRGVDDPVIDLRSAAPSAWRPQRVVLGDVTLVPPKPIPTQGRLGDLRKISLASLRGQRDWMTRLAPAPTHWYTHGFSLIGLWPRNSQPLTLTLVYAALPPALSWSQPTQQADLPVQWHPVIADLAAPLMQIKEGRGECQQAIQQMEALLKIEPLRQLLKQMQAEKYRERALAQKAEG